MTMRGYRQFMALVRKEAKTLRGAAVVLAMLVVAKEAAQLYYYLRYPEAFFHLYGSSVFPGVPLYRGFRIASTGFTYTLHVLLPVVLVLYLFIGERLSRTNVQLHALPVPRAWWITAKIVAPACILGALFMFSLLLMLLEPLLRQKFMFGDAPALTEYLALFTRGGGAFYWLNYFLQLTVLLMTVSFLSYTAAIAAGRHRTVVWIVVMVAVMACVPLLDAQLRPIFSGYLTGQQVWNYHTFWWYLIGYPLAWIALTLGAGLFIYEKYGEA